MNRYYKLSGMQIMCLCLSGPCTSDDAAIGVRILLQLTATVMHTFYRATWTSFHLHGS